MSSKSAKANDRAERAKRAAAAFAEAKKKQRRRNILSAVGVAVVVAVIIGAGVGINALRDKKSTQDFESNVPAAGSTDYGLVVGDDSAPHKIVVYEDFLCPICGVLEATAGERLNTLVSEGTVQIDYRPISILTRISSYSEESLNAFFVVRDTSGPEVAKVFHDLLYADQPAEDSSSFPDADWLVAKAVEAGATEADVRPGIEDDAQADMVKAATDEAAKAGVEGTPTILLDGKVFNDGANWEDIANNLVTAVE